MGSPLDAIGGSARDRGRFAVAGFALAGILAFGIVRAILAGGGCDLDESFGSNARLEMLLVTGAAILGVEIVAFGFHLAPAALRRGNVSRASPTAARRRSGRPDFAEHFDCMVDALGCRSCRGASTRE